MPQLDTPNQTNDLEDAVDYATEVVKAIANEKNVNLSDYQCECFAALVISNNFEACANELWDQIIAKLFTSSTEPVAVE